MSNLKKNIFLTTATTSIITMLSSLNGAESFAKKNNPLQFEKCYGVVKAGKNDCTSTNGKHSCAGASTVDNDENEWIRMPKGLCNKIAGGKPDHNDMNILAVADIKKKRKCYGIAKAGKNDSTNTSGKNSHAGLSEIDKDPNAFIYLPKGLCNKIADGSNKPKSKS